MIEQYALEQKNKDGTPSGKFWMDEAATRAAAREVLETNCRVAGKARDDWLNTYFSKAWGHFDVNRTGKVEVIKMPQFMRFLCSDQQMYLWWESQWKTSCEWRKTNYKLNSVNYFYYLRTIIHKNQTGARPCSHPCLFIFFLFNFVVSNIFFESFNNWMMRHLCFNQNLTLNH